MQFRDLPLDDTLLDALDTMRFETCTPIQEQTIMPLLEGRDLIGVAQTGTGKTAAYLLPILHKLNSGNYPEDAINSIIMAPTRELAQQIDKQVEGLAYFMPISSVAVYGGNDGSRFEQERKGLTMGADIIIATPGRLISHLASGHVDLKRVSFFVLDEADRMLDMGFHDDIMKIASYTDKAVRQTIMFSATMPPDIQQLANDLLTDPVEVKIAPAKPAEGVEQTIYLCYDPQKDRLVKQLIEQRGVDRVILFASRKTKVKELAHTLKIEGQRVAAMHSDLTQHERDDIMRDFRNQKINVLIATDIVSRGIDIDDIQMVINYDVPHDAEDYVHRVGRTARANRTGQAATFVSQKDRYFLQKIEKLIERKLPHINLTDEPDTDTPAQRPGRANNAKNQRNHGNSHRHRQHSHQGGPLQASRPGGVNGKAGQPNSKPQGKRRRSRNKAPEQ